MPRAQTELPARKRLFRTFSSLLKTARSPEFFIIIPALALLTITQASRSESLPNAMKYPQTLQSRLDAALKQKGPSYCPRTRHLHDGRPLYTNRLILQDSPYLLQHAHNPVDWHPWGEEAFTQAREQNKPVFLSIGYATCHWCHVMEEESFENPAVARILNAHFIAIKVDREQHPDVDQAYMTAVMMISGHGGWPMSSFLTGDGKPFFGGTYYPAATFIDLLNKIHAAWEDRHQDIIVQAEQLASAVQMANATRAQIDALGMQAVDAAVEQVLERYECSNCGFSDAPKFPNEPLLLLLLQAAERRPGEQLPQALQHTLSAMAQGGIHDQVGGGFHRYATDSRWLVPHFEKMLYNQAYLARVYARAWRLTGDPLHARVARQTLDYVLREMTSADGGFYSATDADSEGHEGSYFVWSKKEIEKLLAAADAAFVIELFGVTAQGNFEGKNILHLPVSLQEAATRKNIPLQQLLDRLDPLLLSLREHREMRMPPLSDDKIITAWNGMLITALAEAGDILKEPRYSDAAQRAADFLWRSQRPERGILWRVNLQGQASIPGRQDDYVHFCEALLALYDLDGNPLRLQQAAELADEMLDKFLEASSGALIMSQDEILFTQPKDGHDGALPSGNAVAVRVLTRLASRTGKAEYADSAGKILQAFSGDIAQQPSAYAYMLAQLDERLNGETGPRQYAAGGAIRITARHETPYTLDITIDIAEGWHINAHQPLQQDLIATAVELQEQSPWQLQEVHYPEATLEKVRYQANPLALYQGRVQIQVRLAATHESAGPIHLQLQLQACNQDSCLAPETIRLSI